MTSGLIGGIIVGIVAGFLAGKIMRGQGFLVLSVASLADGCSTC